MAVGIICEYNPFHNGHIYHLNKVKELIDKDEEIILILSGNFTQRGNISIIEKYDKAKLAIKYGIDLVVELPFEFATESSDFFAKGSISLLNILKCNKIIFGSELNNIEQIKKLAEVQISNKEYDILVKEELDKGLNYPTAMNNALKKISCESITTPNDLLALSYIKEIIKNKYNIEPISIKRTNNYNNKEISGGIDSATSIREALITNKDISKSVPKETIQLIQNINDNDIFKYLKYKILEEDNLDIYETVDEGIDNKLKKEIRNCNSIEELIEKIKSKRYTYNKLKRMFIHILCSYTKKDNSNKDIKYIRVLGFTNKGQKYLNKIKKDISIPIITNINKQNIDLLKTEIKVDSIYNLITNRNDNIYNKKPITEKDC